MKCILIKRHDQKVMAQTTKQSNLKQTGNEKIVLQLQFLNLPFH